MTRTASYASLSCRRRQLNRFLTTRCSDHSVVTSQNVLSLVKTIEDECKNKVCQIHDTKEVVSSDLPKKYILSMFPYPSGKLHMGHVRVYTLSDALSRYYQMRGFKVIHPIGWDAFGLPAENAALKYNISPKVWTTHNIEVMRSQLKRLNLNFDWHRELTTCDTSYYKWTQWLFLQLFRKGLAYQKTAHVNWDPIDQTVLADEQVDSDGRSWRSGAVVEKRLLKQWFFKTSRYAKSLFEGLKDESLHNWRDIRKIQETWIGDWRAGHVVTLDIKSRNDHISVWTDEIHRIHEMLAIFVTPDHSICSILDSPFNTPVLSSVYEVESGHKTLTGENASLSIKFELFKLNALVKNPIIETEKVPIYMVNLSTPNNSPSRFNAIFDKGSDSFVMFQSVSGDDCGGMSKQKKFRSHILDEMLSKGLISSKKESENFDTNSDILKRLETEDRCYPCSSHLRDWPVSRQRYWGTPIPIIHCPSCGPVESDELPVPLPPLDATLTSSNSNTMKSLKSHAPKEWGCTPCPRCAHSNCQRETDTLDTFVDSSWYFLRFLDAKNSNELVSKALQSDFMPVDLYIGGKEHATLHLYYARFITHFLQDLGISQVSEPFKSLLTQGMVKGRSYKIRATGEYISPENVTRNEMGEYFEKDSNLPLDVEFEKMSKSKLNGVDPESMLDRYGSDTLRWMMFCDVGPHSDRNWSEDSMSRILKIQVKLFNLLSSYLEKKEDISLLLDENNSDEWTEKLFDARNYYLKGINFAMEVTRNLAFVTSRIQSYVNELSRVSDEVISNCAEFERGLATVIVILYPVAPHISFHMWEKFRDGKKFRKGAEFDFTKSVIEQKWPDLDENYLLKLHVSVKRSGAASRLTCLSVPVHQFRELDSDKALKVAANSQEVMDLIEASENPKQAAALHTFKFSEDSQSGSSALNCYEAFLTIKVDLSSRQLDEMKRFEQKDKKKGKKQQKNIPKNGENTVLRSVG